MWVLPRLPRSTHTPVGVSPVTMADAVVAVGGEAHTPYAAYRALSPARRHGLATCTLGAMHGGEVSVDWSFIRVSTTWAPVLTDLYYTVQT